MLFFTALLCAAAPSPAQAQTVGLTLAPNSDDTPWVVAGDQSGGQTINLRLEHFTGNAVFISSYVLPGASGKGSFVIAFDPSGHVWVTGADTSGSNSGVGVWEFNSTGETLLGQTTFFSAIGGQIRVGAMAMDSSGNAWVPVAEAYASNTYQYDLLEFGPGAVFASSSVYQRGGGVDGGFSAGIDSSHNIWVAGVSSNPANGQTDMALWKHNASGILQSGYPVFWSNAYNGIGGNNNINIELGVNSGTIWIATNKQFATCTDSDFALLAYNTSGVLISSSIWHDTNDVGSTPNALAFNLQGGSNVWAIGQSAGETALWEYNSSGVLQGGYPQTSSAGSNGLVVFGSEIVVFNSGSNGDMPNFFNSQGTISGAAGASSCSLPPGPGYISGTITNPSGFADGASLYIGVSTSDFEGNGDPTFYPFTTSAATTYNYSLSVQAPASYELVAVYGNPQDITSTTPIGGYNNFSAVPVTSGSTTSGVNFSISPDNTPPASAITSFVNGSTLTALSSISGTASDNTGVGKIFFAVEDLNTGLWWDVNSQQWLTPGTTPYFQNANVANSGTPSAVVWTQNVATGAYQNSNNFGGVAGFLATGHQYEVIAEAEDFAQNFQSAPAARSFYWNGANGQAPPAAPQNLFSQVLGVSSITWNWNASNGATGYGVWSGTSVFISSVTQASFTGTQLSTNTVYQLCVEAFNAYGQSSLTCASPIYTFAAAPGQPVFTFVSSGSLVYTWAANGNPPGTTYQAYISTNNFATIYSIDNTTQTIAVFYGQVTSGLTFSAAVQAFSGNNYGSAYSQTASTTVFAPPPPPQNIQGQALGISSISWNWSAATGATSYNLYSTTGSFLGSVSTTSYLEVSLATASPNNLCVSGVNAAGEGLQNCSSAVYTFAAVPGTPYFTAVSSSALSVQWDPEGGNGSVIFQVLLSTDGFVNNVSTPVAFSAAYQQDYANLTRLSSDTTYYVEVQAQNGAGQNTAFSPVSSTMTLTAQPHAPRDLQASADDPNKRVLLSWQPALSGVPAASYNIYLGVVADTTTFVPLAQGVTTTFYADYVGRYGIAFQQSGTYYYQVSGVNADGVEGRRSTETLAGLDIFPPQTAPDLRLYGGDPSQGNLQLAWTAPSDDFSGTALYYLYTSPTLPVTQTATITIAAMAPGSAVTYTVAVTSTQALYFAEASQDGAGNVSPLSNVLLFDPVPPVITSISLSSGQFISRPLAVNVQAADNVAVASMAFSVDGVLASSFTTSGYASFFWDTRLLTGGAHNLTVAAFDTFGNSSSATIAETINYAPPNAPSIVSPSPGWSTKVATINVTGTADLAVNVQVMANGLDLDTAPSIGGSWAIFPETLPQAGDVALAAVAYETRGFSAPSTAVNGVYSPMAPNPPELPTAEALAGGLAQISWTAPSQGTIPAFYRVYRSTDDTILTGGNPPDPSLLVTDNITQLTYTDTPAVDDLYFYGVTAVDGAGNESLLSDIVYVVTDRVPPTAQVLFSTPTAITNGSYAPFFHLSKPLSQPPIFTFTPPGLNAQPIALNLTGITATLWQATITITAAMSTGTANFAFQGTDLVGNVGTAISSSTIEIDNVGPVGLLALSKASPLSVGPLTFNLTLDTAAAAPPSLGVTPRNGPVLEVLLAAAAPFDGTAWTGNIIIDSNTGDGQAFVSYSATDTLGNANTLLLGTTNFVIDTIPPDPPLAVRVNSLPSAQVLVTWSAPEFGERPAYYHVYRDSVQISTNVTPASDGTGSYLDQTTEGTHLYQVSSLDLAGNESAPTDPTAVARATPPNAPTNVSAVLVNQGQPEIQLTWQAATGGVTAASFNVYRTTYAATSVVGIAPLNRNAVSPLIDSPAADAVYFYGVTALDIVGNESMISAQSSVTWTQGAPTVTITSVTNGAYYNVSVAPNYTIVDLLLDTTSVHALLNGNNFVSGTTITAEGQYTLSVTAANIVGHVASASVSFVIDKTPPAIAFSVGNGATLTSTSPVSVGVTVTDLNPGASTFILTNMLTSASGPYVPGSPIAQNGQYALAVTAVDLAGNRSTATLSFSVEVGPPSPLGLTVTIENTALISWRSPEPDVVAYRVLRDGTRISASLLQGLFFEDTGYTPGPHVYQVMAVDANGIVGPPAQATVPAGSLSLPALTLTRGFLDLLQPAVQNNSASPITVGPAVVTLIGASGFAVASTTSPTLSAAVGQTVSLQDVLATPSNLSTTSVAHVSVALPTDAGSSVYLAGDYNLTTQFPAQPILQVYPGALIAGTASPVQVQFYNRGSASMDVITAQVSGSTTIPTNSVSVQLQTAQGTLFASGGLLQADNGANAASTSAGQVFYVTIPAGQSFTFDAVSVLVPNTAAASLNVVATVSTPAYNLAGLDINGAQSFTSSVAQGTVSQPAYTATSKTDALFYDQGSSITITGKATFTASGLPAPNVPVTVQIVGNGFTRTENALTNSSGCYTTGYFPSPSEAGTYTTYAAAPAVQTAGVQATFNIVGFGYVYSSYQAIVAQNGSVNFTIPLLNTGAVPITNLTSSVTFLTGTGVGLSVAPGGLPSSLAAGAQGSLSLTATAAPLSSSGTFTLAVTESHGFTRYLPVALSVVPAQVIASVTPPSISIGMLAGSVQSVTLTLKNQGFQTWQSVSISAPSLSWVTIQGQAAVGNIPPGGNANVVLQFAPPSSLPNQTYAASPLVQITSLNSPAIGVQAAVAVTSVLQGDVLASVIQADLPPTNSGQGVPVPGAQVNLLSLDISGLNFTMNADQNGLAVFSKIPSGNYSWNISANGFQTLSGSLTVQPGMSNPLNALMATSVVSYQWTVVPTTIQDIYNVVLSLTYRTDLPVPVLIVDPPTATYNLNLGQSAFGQYTLTNKGSVAAQNISLAPTMDPGLDIELPFTTMAQLDPGESVVVPYKVTFVHESSCDKNGRVNNAGSSNCPFNGSSVSTAVSFLLSMIGLGPGCGPGVAGQPGKPGQSSGSGVGPYSDGLGSASGGITLGQLVQPQMCGGNGPQSGCYSGGSCPIKQKTPGGPPISKTGPPTQTVHPPTGTAAPPASPPNCPGGGCASPALTIAPSYRSDIATNLVISSGPFGYGWSGDYFQYVQWGGAGGITTMVDGNGVGTGFYQMSALLPPTVVSAGPSGGGSAAYTTCTFPTFVPPPGVHDALTETGLSGCVDPVTPPPGFTYSYLNGTAIQFVPSPLQPNIYLPYLLTDRNGNTVNFTRDSQGRLTQLTDIHHRTDTFAYDANNRVITVTDNAGRQAYYAYSVADDQTTFTDVNGDVTHYAYDSSHRMTQITYPNGGVHNYTYDSQNRVLTESDDSGNNRYTYVYVASTTAAGVNFGNTTVTDALGHATVYNWTDLDGLKEINSVVNAAGNSSAATYTPDAQLSTYTDNLGRAASFTYDRNGMMTSAANAAGGTSQAVNAGPFSELTSATDPKGNMATLTYDGFGNLVQTQDAANDFTLAGYDQQGHITSIKDTLGNVRTLSYNGNGAVIAITDPLGRTDNLSRDALNRMTRNTDPAGNQTSFVYDNASNITQIKDALNDVTNFTYQPGRAKRHLTSMTDADSHATSFSYDVSGRVISVKNALGQNASLTYDAKSRPASMTTRNNQTIALGYDNLDRLTQITQREGSVNLSYDAVNNMVSAGNYNGSALGLTYDSLHRVTQIVETLPNGYPITIGFTYDANGNRTGMSTPFGSFSYSYDSLNRVTRVGNPFGQTTSLSYDGLGRRTQINLPNGTQTSYAYDAASHVLQVMHQKTANQSAIAFANYNYDADGNRTAITDLRGMHTFSYDSLNRLTTANHPGAANLPVQSETFAYDAVGNRTSDAVRTNYVYDAANRIVSDSSFTYTTDANGNVLTRTGRNSGQTTTFIYDSANRLVAANNPSGATSSYKYDPTGRRVERTVNGTTYRYVYDGPHILAILDGNNNLLTSFTYGLGVAPISIRSNGQDYFFHTDALGSVVALTDINGNIVETYQYEAFGKALIKDAQGSTHSQSTVSNPFMFAGAEFDPETGLYHMGFRYYGSESGRFLQEDYIPSIDQYVYAHNNPTLLVDPLGLCPTDNPILNLLGGFGNGLSLGITGTQGGFYNPNSGAYEFGTVFGGAWDVGLLWAAGLYGGANSVFWAGGSEAQVFAEELGTTLGQTFWGSILAELGVDSGNMIWGLASATFAANASGEATAVLYYVGETSWWLVEEVILEANGVTITVITLAP
jgi:RHS repeat-associated protein